MTTTKNKKKTELAVKGETRINELQIFERVANIIEMRKSRAGAYANSEVTMMYWEVGHYINSVVLDESRAEYGKKILPTLSAKLSWSHIIELLPLQTDEARLYYAEDVNKRGLSVQELRHQISRKAFERREIANTGLASESAVPFNVFKDPYLLDILELKDNYLEADLEKAILTDIESFILEFGNGFSFVARQKRMILDDEDIVLDLLFYHRILKRLVAVELKLGKFKAEYFGQMALYLKWLDRYERQPGEEAPIGLILCATASREKIEMLELDKSGIAVAEYWTCMPPKAEFERKIREILAQAKERLARRKMLGDSGVRQGIDYFYEAKDDDED